MSTTKHLNNTDHHFSENMQTGEVKIVAVKSKDQLADLLTKPLSEDLFIHF